MQVPQTFLCRTWVAKLTNPVSCLSVMSPYHMRSLLL
jgi:hypothetical protein